MTQKPHHDFLPGLRQQLRSGKLDRREFIRCAALLGVSVGIAYDAAGITAPAMAADNSPFPAPEPGAKRGGTLRVGQMVARMVDPATYNWNEMANQTRPMLDYLTMIGTDNVVRPMLIESWKPSADLKTWTLHVRKNVMWHNGEELTAEHVAWNIRRWADPALGSSNQGLSTFLALTETTGGRDTKGNVQRRSLTGGVEVLDAHTVKLNLAQPVLSVAEDCSEYCTLILHPSFTPPLSRHPLGTGPYTLSELKVGERCTLKRVTKTTDGKDFRYWGGDVYLDEIHFYSYDQENAAIALASGSVDAIYDLSIEQLELARTIEGAQISSVDTAQTLCLRMQVDAKPFDDIRVRRAIVKAADNAAIKSVIFPDHGSVAYNYHVAPAQPEYYPLPPLVRDLPGAKQLLKEAGFEHGLDLTITTGNGDGPWHQAVCEALRDQLKEVGIHLKVDVIPTTKYWEVWKTLPFSATSWAHRPLATMTLAQAYRSGAAWNESHYSNPEFDAALSDAEAALDAAARKIKMQKVEKILQDSALMVQPFWRPIFVLSTNRVHGYRAHPARQMQLTKVWLG